MNNRLLHTVLTIVFALLLLSGAVLFMFDVPYAEYVFALGALLSIVQSFLYAIQNRSVDCRIQRLHRLGFVASLFLGIAAWLMFMGNNSWVPFVLIYALVVFFLSFRS